MSASFKDLRVWQEAVRFAVEVPYWRYIRRFWSQRNYNT